MTTKVKGAMIGTVLADGSTAPRTLEDRFADTVNVKDFGAVGDGVADDTVAIQAALNYAQQFTYPLVPAVYIPAGVYMVSNTITVPSYTNLFGDGYYSILQVQHNLPAGSYSVLRIDSDGANGVHLRNFSIWGENNQQANNPDVWALDIQPAAHAAIYNLFENLYFKEMSSGSVRITQAGMDNSQFTNCMFRDSKGVAAFYSTSMERVEIINCRIRSGKAGICHGILLDGAGNRYNTIRGCRIDDNSGWAVVISNAQNHNLIEGNNFTSNALGAIWVDRTAYTIINDNKVVAHVEGIKLESADNTIISGNNLSGINGHAVQIDDSDKGNVTGNILENGGTSTDALLHVTDSDYGVYAGNSIIDAQGHSIFFVSASRNNITGNTILNGGGNALNAFSGIVLDSVSVGNVVTSNILTANTSARLHSSILVGHAQCVDTVVVHNVLANFITNGVTDSGTGTVTTLTGNVT